MKFHIEISFELLAIKFFVDNFFRPFPSIKRSHSVLSSSKPSCFQRPSPSHQPLHILLHYIQKSSPWSSPSWKLRFDHPSYIFLVSPMTSPYHLSLPSPIFIPNRSTLTVPLMYSFLILSFLVTPIANLHIFISVKILVDCST